MQIVSSNVQTQVTLFGDQSLWFLLSSNLVTILLASRGDLNLVSIMWVYWFQSVTIGIFNFVRILQLKEFSTERFEINGHSVPPTERTKTQTAYFFLFHYGVFHLAYLFFLVNPPRGFPEMEAGVGMITATIFSGALFFCNHLFSYLYNRPRDTKKQNIGNLMFYPYLRIIPMHATIVIGSAYSGALLFFLVIKTISDVIMHIIEHRVLRKAEEVDISTPR